MHCKECGKKLIESDMCPVKAELDAWKWGFVIINVLMSVCIIGIIAYHSELFMNLLK